MNELRFIIGNEVASFKYKGKRYKPGELVVLPDNFPAHLYPFLKRHADKPAARVVPAPARATAPAPRPAPPPAPAKSRLPLRR